MTPELTDAVESANSQYDRITGLFRRGRSTKGLAVRDSVLDDVNAALAEAVGMEYLLPLLDQEPTSP